MSETVVTVVGSGTLVPDGARGSAAHHVRTDRASILLDCGSGTLHALDRLGIDWRTLTHIAVTHYHYDHVGDLPALLIALEHGVTTPREAPLELLGPVGLGAYLRGVSEALGIDFLEQAFPVTVTELAPGRDVADAPSGVTWRAHAARHTEESIALVIEAEDGTVAYTGDTGPSEPLAEALAGAHVLVAECSHPDPPPTDLHLTPDTLAAFAAVARPELLVVTHVYPSQRPRDVVSRISERHPGRVVAAEDGLVVRIRPGGTTVDLPGRQVYT